MDDFNKKIRKIIYFFIAVFIIALIVTIIGLLILKYDVEGESNMPFELSQIVVISTAEGIHTEGESIWNLDLVQNNDIYIHISKNKNYRQTEIIKNIILNNFKVDEEPQKGEIVIYKPCEDENKNYEYSEEYIVKDSLIYTGSETTNAKEQYISNQGGVVLLRFANKNLRNI